MQQRGVIFWWEKRLWILPIDDIGRPDRYARRLCDSACQSLTKLDADEMAIVNFERTTTASGSSYSIDVLVGKTVKFCLPIAELIESQSLIQLLQGVRVDTINPLYLDPGSAHG